MARLSGSAGCWSAAPAALRPFPVARVVTSVAGFRSNVGCRTLVSLGGVGLIITRLYESKRRWSCITILALGFLFRVLWLTLATLRGNRHEGAEENSFRVAAPNPEA